MSIDVIIADDHTILRQALASLMDGQDDIQVVATGADGNEAVRLVAAHQPDVLLMDITMPSLNGIDATELVLERCPHCKVIALSVHREEVIVASMLRAGARGYLIKDCAHQELLLAIRTVAKGQTYLSPAVTRLVVDEYLKAKKCSPGTQLEALSQRERQVLQLTAEGYPSKHIADRLGVSAKTVDTYRRRIMIKTDADSVAALTKIALRLGLTSLEY